MQVVPTSAEKQEHWFGNQAEAQTTNCFASATLSAAIQFLTVVDELLAPLDIAMIYQLPQQSPATLDLGFWIGH